MTKQQLPPDVADEPSPPFEDALAKLERSVSQLEDGKLGLSQSLQCYEEGVKQLKLCYRALEIAERKIELLAGVDAEGRAITEPFDDGEMTLDEKAAARSQRRSRPASRNRAADQERDSSGELFS